MNKEKQIKETWCKSPDYGDVKFSNPSARQREVLEEYNRIIELIDTSPNDTELGSKIRINRKILKLC